MKKWVECWAVPTLFFGFFVFTVYSNVFDWDQHLTFAEADVRSWLWSREIPLWSYQLCAGGTRIGDPQAFGLSPLILVHLLFGSYWGWKILIALSAAVGFYYLHRLRKDFLPDLDPNLARLLIASYIFGNFYLWQFHHGHLTFVLHYWVLGLLYYFLLAMEQRFSSRSVGMVCLLTWLVATAGFYHTAVFLGLPLLGTAGILFLAKLTKEIRRKNSFQEILRRFRGLAIFSGAFVAGLLAALFKLLPVLEHQRANPRIEDSSHEMLTLPAFVANLFLPTINYKFLGIFSQDYSWGIWEVSVFTLGALAFLAICVQKPRLLLLSFSRGTLAQFAAIFFLVTFALYLGGDSRAYPYQWINHTLFQDSTRVVGRFGHNLTLAIMIFTMVFAKESAGIYRVLTNSKVQALGFGLILLNFFSFSPTLYDSLKPQFFWNLPRSREGEMREVYLTHARHDRQAQMFPPMLMGQAVANCYNPLRREMAFTWEASEKNEITRQFGGTALPFLRFDSKPNAKCVADSFFTQNRIHISKECPEGCLLMNTLRDAERNHFYKGPSGGLYCFKAGANP